MKITIYGTDNSLNQKHAEDLIKYKNIVNNISNINDIDMDIDIDNIKLKMFECLLHAADISNPTKETNYYITWSDKINEEFCEQSKEVHTYDEIKEIKCYKRNDKKYVESQLSFFDNVFEVFYKPFCEVFIHLKYLYQNYEKNKELLIKGAETNL